MNYHPYVIPFLLLCLPHVTSTQYLTYSYSTVVSCGTFLPVPSSPLVSTSPSNANEIHIDMPPCPGCDCPTCTTERVYVTTVVALNASSQLASQVFTVHETYSGASAIPTLLGGEHEHDHTNAHGDSETEATNGEAPSPSYGFTTTVQTCSGASGASKVTVTYPMTVATSLESATGGVQGVPQGKVGVSGDEGKAKVGGGDSGTTPQQPPPTTTNGAAAGRGVDVFGALVAVGVSGVLAVLVGF